MVNKLGQDIIPPNNENCLSFWGDKVEKFKIWVNSSTITPEKFMGSGWLLNFAKGLSQHTLPPSFMTIHWKIFKKQSAQYHFEQFELNKGNNTKVLYDIWLVIECSGEIMPTNIITKFDTPSLMMIQLKKIKLQSGQG